ncbi:MAG: hypothetical protein RLP02_01745, partial [Coleofasciculus sp. C2-GNP5-27]
SRWLLHCEYMQKPTSYTKLLCRNQLNSGCIDRMRSLPTSAYSGLPFIGAIASPLSHIHIYSASCNLASTEHCGTLFQIPLAHSKCDRTHQ